jgi:endonuclease-3
MTSYDSKILEKLDLLIKEPKCELEYNNSYELLIAIVLSSQTTDKRVNEITKYLFKEYPTFSTLEKADIKHVEEIIKSLGLYKIKARRIILLARIIINEYNSIIPLDFDELLKIPGIGRKTANLYVLLNGMDGFAVDTHVKRVAERLYLCSGTFREVEEELKKIFAREIWGKLHHQLLLFGRYTCKAKKPICENCLFTKNCSYYDKAIDKSKN